MICLENTVQQAWTAYSDSDKLVDTVSKEQEIDSRFSPNHSDKTFAIFDEMVW